MTTAPMASGSTSSSSQFFPDSAPVKRPFAPSAPEHQALDGIAPRTFTRTDSRGENRYANRPPDEIQNSLCNVGMRARMSVERGFVGVQPAAASIPEPTAHPASLSNSTRSVWARTNTAPSYNRANELVPFGATGTDLPFWGATAPVPEEAGDEAEAMSTSSLGKRRTADGDGGGDDDDDDDVAFKAPDESMDADDVLGGFMSDDEDGGDEVAITPAAAPAPFAATNTHTTTTGRPAHPFPKRTFKQAQTMPVSSGLANHMAGGRVQRSRDDMDTAADDGDQRYKAWKFEEYAKRYDF